MERRVVGVTMGDPCGIGPEIVVRALSRRRDWFGTSIVALGDPVVLAEAASRFGEGLRVVGAEDVPTALARLDEGTLPVVAVASFGPVEGRWGQIRKDAGAAALATIEAAADLGARGVLAAVATAPVSKESLHLAGSDVPGHAEIFARRAGVRGVATMLAHGDFRVVHLSTHVPLREACDLVRRERVERVTRMTHETLQGMGIERPRVAVAALNPHGGDGGLFGREEIDELMPAVAALRDEGLDVHGPVPADIVFSQARGGMWDAVVAMFHDQGHIPIKVASFVWDQGAGRWTSTGGVTLTLGLPFPRTSVDHGTAFDVAGRGVADEGAMAGAVELAARMASQRTPSSRSL